MATTIFSGYVSVRECIHSWMMQKGVLDAWSLKATVPPVFASSKKWVRQEDVLSSLNDVMNPPEKG